MFHSRNSITTGGIQSNRVNCWLQNYNKLSHKASNLKNESRYLIISFLKISFFYQISVSREDKKNIYQS